jgi:CDP-paratose 2-epimerase
MKVLITGAAGFVGTNLTLRLLKAGHEVVGLDSLSRRGTETNLARIKAEYPKFEFKQVEIEDMPSEVYRVKPEVLYHFAAQVAVTSSVINPARDFKINAEGTFKIANACHQLGIPVIYTSTNKVFGDNVNNVPVEESETRYDFAGKLKGKGIAEDFPIDAKHHTPYGCSKLVGDIYVREFGGVVNRCSCMYGPNQFGIVDQGWLSHIAQQIIKKNPITIYGDGKQLRDALHSDDVTRLLEAEGLALMDGKDIRGEVFNVGGGHRNTISLLELCDMWGVKRNELKFEAWRPADQKVFYCDIAKAKKVFGWEPQVDVRKGAKDLYEWTKRDIQKAK